MLKLMRTSLRRFATAESYPAPTYTLPFDPYTVDENLYKDVNSKIKFTTGYALVEVEPFPRMKIMKVAKHLLHRVKNELPENLLARTFMEEQYKYYMELTHETKDILELEQKLDTDCIETFIEALAKETLFIDFMVSERIWEVDYTEEGMEILRVDKPESEERLGYEKKLPQTPKAVIEDR